MPETYTAIVEQAETIARDVRELVLRPTQGEVLSYQAGQWLSLRLPVGDKPPLVRAYTLATTPHPQGELTLCFDRVPGGLGSEYLWSLHPGASIEFSGPVGNFVLPEGSGYLLLVARHTGIVPFRAMLQTLVVASMTGGARRKVQLVYGAQTPDDLPYHRDLVALDAHANWFEYLPVVQSPDAQWTGAVGDELSVLQTLELAPASCTPMLCGVREWTFPARAFFMERGWERRAVRVENYNGPTAR